MWLLVCTVQMVALINVEWLSLCLAVKSCLPWSSHQLHSSMFYPAAAAEITAAAAANASASSKHASQPSPLPPPPPPLPSRHATTLRVDQSAGASTRGAPLADRRDEPTAFTPGERALFSTSERISFTDEEQWRTLMKPYRLAVSRWEQEQAAHAKRCESQRNLHFGDSDSSSLTALSTSSSASAAFMCTD